MYSLLIKWRGAVTAEAEADLLSADILQIAHLYPVLPPTYPALYHTELRFAVPDVSPFKNDYKFLLCLPVF